MAKTKLPEFIVNSEYSKELFLKQVEKIYDEHKYVRFTISTGRQRTNKQSRSLHLYFDRLARALNDAGFSLRKVLEMRPQMDIDWDGDLIKENWWRPLQESIINKSSTTEADRKEYTIIYETLNRFTAENFGISIAFPSKDDLL